MTNETRQLPQETIICAISRTIHSFLPTTLGESTVSRGERHVTDRLKAGGHSCTFRYSVCYAICEFCPRRNHWHAPPTPNLQRRLPSTFVLYTSNCARRIHFVRSRCRDAHGSLFLLRIKVVDEHACRSTSSQTRNLSRESGERTIEVPHTRY